MNTEFTKVLENWITEAMSDLWQLPVNTTPAQWVTKHLTDWMKNRIEDDLAEVEGSAATLREYAGQLGGWANTELGDLMHELAHLDGNIGQLRLSLCLGEKER